MTRAGVGIALVLALACLPPTRVRAQQAQDDIVSPEQSSELLSDPGDAPVEAPSDAPSEPVPTPEQEAVGDPNAEAADQAATPSEPAAATQPPAPAAEPIVIEDPVVTPKRELTLSFTLGGGVGTFSFVRPTAAGKQRMPRTAYAALDLALRAHLWPKRAVSLETLLDYHSSLGLQVRADPLFGLSQDVALRVQRVELSFAPIVRLGTPERSPALAFPVGALLRTLVPEVHQFGVPDLVLAGPLLRAELVLPLGTVAMLRIGPEASWLLYVDKTLTRQGAGSQGFTLAGAAWLEAQVSSAFSVGLSYRQAHGFVPGGGRGYRDVERFVTALASGRW